MKNLIFFGLVAVLLGTVSCKKCKECHYDTQSGEVEVGELCDDDLKNAEANGYDTGDTIVTIHCEEH